jgi:hypothetical protein
MNKQEKGYFLTKCRICFIFTFYFGAKVQLIL